MVEPTHRARREEARAQLMHVVRELLEVRPWSAITVGDLTTSLGWSRTAFYQHFPDREELLSAMLAELNTSLHGVALDWMRGGVDPPAEHRAAIRALVGVYIEHGRVLRAAADASTSDRGLHEAWTSVRDGLVTATTRAIERDVANGHARVDDPHEMSRALSAATEQYLLLSFGRAPLSDPDSVTATLTTVWTRTLYPIP